MSLKTLPKPLVFLIFGAFGSLLGWGGGELAAKLQPPAAPPVAGSGPEVTLVRPDAFRRNVPAGASASPSMLFEPEVQRRLDAAGASASGDIKLALSWGTTDDLDIHCIEPGGAHIFFGKPRAPSGGELDVDQNASRPLRTDPVEHIFWPVGKAPQGRYQVLVHRFKDNSGAAEIPYRVFLAVGELRREVQGVVTTTDIPTSPVLTFEYEVAPAGEASAGPPPVSPLVGVLMVAWTLGLLSFGVAASICSVQSRMLGRGSWIPSGFGKIVLLGVLGGLLAGAIGQGLLASAASMHAGADTRFLRTFAWIVAGAVLGLGFSFFIPNLERTRAVLAGVVGGLVAGLVVSSHAMSAPTLTRLAACVVMGASVGLAIAWVESMAREGFIRVHWGPGEVSTVNLGARPVSVGTGAEATIRIPRSTGYPAIVADFRIEDGKALMRHHMTGAVHPLRDGNKMVLGTVTLEVRLFS